MTGRGSPSDARTRATRCRSSIAWRRAPPPAVVAARIESHTGPGDVVADLFGRGGWVARAAVDRQRRAVSLESSPLTRMLAEVVLRPPDVRHLDAAFQGMAASPRRESSLKVSIGDLFATRCATCGRTLVVDEIIWAVGPTEAAIAGPDRGRSPATTAARSAATSAAAPSSARRRSTRTTSAGPRPTSGRRRHAVLAAGPVPGGPRRRDAARRAARPPHARQLVGLGGDPRADREATCAPRPSWPPCGSRSSTRSCRPAGLATGPGRPRDRSGSRRATSGCRVRHAVPRAQPVARLRGRLPAGPRLRPAPRARRARSRPGAPRRGPAEPRRGRGDGRSSA